MILFAVHAVLFLYRGELRGAHALWAAYHMPVRRGAPHTPALETGPVRCTSQSLVVHTQPADETFLLLKSSWP